MTLFKHDRLESLSAHTEGQMQAKASQFEPRKKAAKADEEDEGSRNPYSFCSGLSDEDEHDDETDHERETKHQNSEGNTWRKTKHEYNEGNISSRENSLSNNNSSIHNESTKSTLAPTISSSSDEASEISLQDRRIYASLYNKPPPGKENDLRIEIEENPLLWVAPTPWKQEDLMQDDSDSGSVSDAISFHSEEPKSKEILDREDQEERVKTYKDAQFKSVVQQLLVGEGIKEETNHGEGDWSRIIISLASEATNYIKPDMNIEEGMDPRDMNCGEGMDPGGYVKVKSVASGQPSESSRIVKGIVCGRNVAHKRMKTRLIEPKILIFGCALESIHKHVSSLKVVEKEDTDTLTLVLTRMDAFHPNLLLVEKTVSGQAQDWILKKDISLVLNVKRHLLERIAKCTDATIIPSLDHLTSNRPIKVGQCQLFHVERYMEEHSRAGEDSRKVSKALMFFEGCPKPLGCTALLQGSSKKELRKLKAVLKLAVFAAYHLALETSFLADEGATLDDMDSYYHSPMRIFLPEMKLKSDMCGVASLDSSVPASETDGERSYCSITTSGPENNSADNRSFHLGERLLISARMTEGHAQDVDHEQFPSTQSDHRSILVSFSRSCLKKAMVCEGRRLLRIKYYGTFDKPLGRFLRENVFDMNYICPVCQQPREAHVDCYTHQQGSLRIFTHRQDSALPGEIEGKIWMWYRCLKCPRVNGAPPSSRRVLMSDSAWGLSFGKFLELNFSSHAAASRVASCGHSVHHHCLRFYGFGKMMACFQYAPVHVYSVHLPPSLLEVHSIDHENWLQREVHEIEEKVHSVFKFIWNQLHEEKMDRNGHKILEFQNKVLEVEDILSKQEAKFKIALHQPHVDIFQLNKIRRSLSNQASLWENCIKKQNFDEVDLVLSVPSDISFGNVNNKRSEEFIKGQNVVVPSVEVTQSIDPQSEVSEKIVDTSDSLKLYESDKDNQNLATSEVSPVDESSEVGLLRELDNNDMATSGETPLNPVLHEEPDVTDLRNPIRYYQSAEILPNFQNTIVYSLSHIWSSGEQIEDNGQYLLNGDSHAEGTFPSGTLNEYSSLVHNGDNRYAGEYESSDIQRWINTSHSSSPRHYNGDTDRELETQQSKEGFFSISSSTISPPEQVAAHEEPKEMFSISSSSISHPEQVAAPEELKELLPISSPTISHPEQVAAPEELKELLPISSPTISHSEQVAAPEELKELLPISSPTISHPEQVMAPVEMEETIVYLYDDEPTSIIASAILRSEHQNHALSIKMEGQKDENPILEEKETDRRLLDSDGGLFHTVHRVESGAEQIIGNGTNGLLPADPHVRIEFGDDLSQEKGKYTVTCYFAKQFDGLRKRCCRSTRDFIRSLCRCKKWGAQGGKSKVFFAKTADDRFVVKQVTKTELDSFMTFSSSYFKYISDTVGTGSPTCLAKILGIYQVMVKHGKGGREMRMDLLIMENLLYGQHITRVYDLKGSLRSRYNADLNRKDAVLLDQNLLESLQTSPIFISNKDKRLLERAIWNDTAFLASVAVMDYSLLVGIDEDRQELFVGMIDFLRQYTWDKHLETWVKASGILGGPKNTPPTVVSPQQYKKRFRKAMSSYFLLVPDDTPQPGSGSQHSDRSEENSNLERHRSSDDFDT